MPIAIDSDHLDLFNGARQMLAAREAAALARTLLEGEGDDSALWREFSDLGWQGLHLPEAVGGQGFGLPEQVVVLEALGEVLAGGSYTATVAASAALAVGGAAADLVEPLATGAGRAAVVVHPDVDRADGRLRLDGVAMGGGVPVDLLVAVVGQDLVVLRGDAEGVELRPSPAFDASLRAASLHVDVAEAGATVLAGAGPRGLALIRLAFAAEAVGAGQAATAAAVDYAKVREQFGRPIGSFQAVKHRLADMRVIAEQATAAVWQAARTSVEDVDFEVACASALVAASGGLARIADSAGQTYGGIGFTWEHDHHLTLRHSRALLNIFRVNDVLLDDVMAWADEGRLRSFRLELGEEAERYREQCREFRARHDASPESERRALLGAEGYVFPSWPQPYGRAAGPVEQLVIEEELGEIVPVPIEMGMTWLVQGVVHCGTDEQRAKYVEPTVRGELFWCQLFSEPGAGSDAAAISTRATRVEGGWRLNGQKVWTSYGHVADIGLATVRTNPDVKKHKGISTVIVDMKAPGVTVRPIVNIAGEHEFNEIFFDDVFIPDADVVGEVDRGWDVVRVILGHERVGASDEIGWEEIFPHTLPQLLVKSARQHDLGWRRRVAEVVAEDHTIRAMNMRAVVRAVDGIEAGPEANMTKMKHAETMQKATSLALELSGPAGVFDVESRVLFEFLYDKSLTIAGGSSEITRNIIAEQVLGLPRGLVFN